MLQKAMIVITRSDGTAPGRTRASWPLGRLSLFRDRMEIRLFFNRFELPLREIEAIESHLLFQVRIHHSSAGVPDYVSVFGWGLLGNLRKAAQRNGLPLRFR